MEARDSEKLIRFEERMFVVEEIMGMNTVCFD